MSAFRGKAKDEDEYYATTPPMADRSCWAIKQEVPRLLDLSLRKPKFILNPSRFLEPTCGSGTWFPGFRTHWPTAHVKGIEMNPELSQYSRNQGYDVDTDDILNVRLRQQYEVVAGNPPFSLLDKIVPHLIDEAIPEGGVLAMHARTNWLEGRERLHKIHRRYKTSIMMPFAARPGYTADGATDATGYAMFVWVKGYDGPTIQEHIDNTDIQVRWNGTPTRKKNGVIVKEAVLDPKFPDPRTRPVPPMRPPSMVQVGEALQVDPVSSW